MYKSFYQIGVYKPYLDNYKLADKALWYEIHDKELETYVQDTRCISLVSRKPDLNEIIKIRSEHKKPIVFVSLGASASIKQEIDVSDIDYDFLTTRGINLVGSNVYRLPVNMINTQDYIGASEYVIAKGGWSTVAEILLQKKKCALLKRGNNSEDKETELYLTQRNHCISIVQEDLRDIRHLIDRLEKMRPAKYDYYDSTDKIVGEIFELCQTHNYGGIE